jgi:hypothetical protein
VSGDAALAALPPTRRAGSKPFAIEGRNEATQEWETPRTGQRYGAFQAGVQLANRNGALNEIEYSEFVMKVQAFADAMNGAPEFPEMRDEVARPASSTSSPARTTRSSVSRCARAMPPGARATCTRTRPGWASCRRHPRRMVLPASVQASRRRAGPVVRHAGGDVRRPGQSAIRELTLSLDVPQVRAASSPSCACATPPWRWPPPWTA